MRRNVGYKEFARAVEGYAARTRENRGKRALNTVRSKFKNSIIVVREYHGRYEKIPEPIKSQPDRATFGTGESFWTNEYAPCPIRGELIDSLIRRIRCEEVACVVKGQAETVTRNKLKRSSPSLGVSLKIIETLSDHPIAMTNRLSERSIATP